MSQPRESPKGFVLLAFLLIAGLAAMAGAFLGAHLDPHETRCLALVAEAVWEPVVDNKTYAFLLPPDGGVVQHDEEVTKLHPCHDTWVAEYASVTGRRLTTSKHVIVMLGTTMGYAYDMQFITDSRLWIEYHGYTEKSCKYDSTDNSWIVNIQAGEYCDANGIKSPALISSTTCTYIVLTTNTGLFQNPRIFCMFDNPNVEQNTITLYAPPSPPPSSSPSLPPPAPSFPPFVKSSCQNTCSFAPNKNVNTCFASDKDNDNCYSCAYDCTGSSHDYDDQHCSYRHFVCDVGIVGECSSDGHISECPKGPPPQAWAGR